MYRFSQYSRIVLGFEGEKNMPKLNFSGKLPITIRNNILKLPVIPAGAFSIIQDGMQDGHQNVTTSILTGRYTTAPPKNMTKGL